MFFYVMHQSRWTEKKKMQHNLKKKKTHVFCHNLDRYVQQIAVNKIPVRL